MLILEDSCLGASQTGPSPPLKVGMNHKAHDRRACTTRIRCSRLVKTGDLAAAAGFLDTVPDGEREETRAVRAGVGWGTGCSLQTALGLHILLNLSQIYSSPLSSSSLFPPVRPPLLFSLSLPLPRLCSQSPRFSSLFLFPSSFLSSTQCSINVELFSAL